MKKYYNFETAFTSFKNELAEFLKKSKIYFELSGGAGFWHFEIYANEEEAKKINNFLDTIF